MSTIVPKMADEADPGDAFAIKNTGSLGTYRPGGSSS